MVIKVEPITSTLHQTQSQRQYTKQKISLRRKLLPLSKEIFMPYQMEIAAGPRVIKCYLIKAEKQAEFETFCKDKIRPWLEAQPSVTQCDAWLLNYDGKVMLVVTMWESDKPWESIVGLEDYLETVPDKHEYSIKPVPALQFSRTTEEAAKAFSEYLNRVLTNKTPAAKGANG
jgi:hypothetical protein